MEWQVEFFEEENGRCPVEDFLQKLPNAHTGKILQVIRVLREQGPALPFPYSSQVEGPLRELRIHFGRHHYRVLYYGDPQRVFVLLHAFEKRTAQIPLQETSIAKQRMVIDLGKKKGRL